MCREIALFVSVLSALVVLPACQSECPEDSLTLNGRCVSECPPGTIAESGRCIGGSCPEGTRSTTEGCIAFDAGPGPDAGRDSGPVIRMDSGPPRGCGNDVVDEGEECDDGNTTVGDGCENNCSFTCATSADCQNEDLCDGEEQCTAEHVCGPGVPPVCEDDDDCTRERCDPALGCIFPLNDADGDGYAPAETCTTPGLMGGDCEDAIALVHPNAPYRYEEGYCPGGGSCDSRDRTYDYNCDGEVSRQYIGDRPITCVGREIIDCNQQHLWSSASGPRCGRRELSYYCSYDLIGDGGCEFIMMERQQGCR